MKEFIAGLAIAIISALNTLTGGMFLADSPVPEPHNESASAITASADEGGGSVREA